MSKKFSVGIIGCGLIGVKRANSLGENAKLIACADIDESKAKSLANIFDAQFFSDWHKVLELPDIDIIIVATTHNSLAEITKAAVLLNKHVLVEKPAARTLGEITELISFCKDTSQKIRVGFNHRYHPAIIKAKALFANGELGELMFIRARYGHGARIGYDREWRSKPELSGGGELIDQGSHLIDLSRLFLGDLTLAHGFAHTYYWDMPVDDNGFMMLTNPKKQIAFLHASCTEWKNLFSMEIYGKNGKLDISGLGGSYGVEKLTFYKMLPQMGPPETTAWEFPMGDISWLLEFEDFCEDISLNRNPSANLYDAYESLKIINKIYKDSGYDYSA